MITKVRRLALGAAFVFAIAILGATGASAQTYAGVPPPALGGVLGTSGGIAPGTAATSAGQVLAAQVNTPAAVGAQAQARVSGLAFTGGDFIRLVLFAGSMILLGVAITRVARARSPQA
jgi:hypothetical protein